MSDREDSKLPQVRAILGELVRAWPESAADDGPGAGRNNALVDRAMDLVMDLAEPLHQLSWEPRFEAAFRARFREVFESARGLSGMEELCQQLAPACTWCMLSVISELSRPAEAP